MRIGLILAVLTGLEIVLRTPDVTGVLLIFTCSPLAAIKFALVVVWFMHLKYDDRRYARFFVMGIAGAVTLYLSCCSPSRCSWR